MNDLISRQAAIDAINSFKKDISNCKSIFPYVKNVQLVQAEEDIWIIQSLPTVDAIAVVRCGECATRDKWGCPWWKDEARPDDWYCANGERREE